MSDTSDKVLSVALSQVGYLEKSKAAVDADLSVLYRFEDGAGNDNYTKYGYEMHNLYPAVMDYPAAWCDCFVDWCFYQAYGKANAKGLLGGDFNDYTPSSANLYKNKKAYHENPEVGDQIFFDNGMRICHTGLVYAVDQDHVYTVEGNTSSESGMVANGGCVRKKTYSRTYARINGYGRPKYDKKSYTLGWHHDQTGWWYAKTSETYAATEWLVISGHWYYFNSAGYAVTGYQEIGDERFFFETRKDKECALLHTDERGTLVEWIV